MRWLRRWLLGDLAERVETLENWCRHHDAPQEAMSTAEIFARLERLSREDLARAAVRSALDSASGPGN